LFYSKKIDNGLAFVLLTSFNEKWSNLLKNGFIVPLVIKSINSLSIPIEKRGYYYVGEVYRNLGNNKDISDSSYQLNMSGYEKKRFSEDESYIAINSYRPLVSKKSIDRGDVNIIRDEERYFDGFNDKNRYLNVIIIFLIILIMAELILQREKNGD